MTVSTIATIASGLTRTLGNQNTKPTAVLNSLVSTAPQSTASDTTNLSAAMTLQNQIAQFRVAAQNIAQGSSLLATADAGASAISRELGKLKDLATKAANVPLSETERMQIDAEFQAIRSRIDSIANSARFGDENLLDGTSAQLKVANENADTKNRSVSSLTDSALFKGANPSISTPANAKQAEAAVIEAQKYTNEQIENIKALQDGLDYASATLESAIQNQDAARSSVDDSDIAELLGNGSTPTKAVDFTQSLFAQTNQLPNNILQLISE